MGRLRGRCRRGERLIGHLPNGHWKTTTFVAGLRNGTITAPFVIDKPTNGEIFLAYVKQGLAPMLRPGDLVIMDNLPAHKVDGVTQAIEAVGARLLYLPPIPPTSIPSRWPLQSSRRSCAKPPSDPSPCSGTKSANCSKTSPTRNAKTTSATQDMRQRRWKTL